MKFKVSKKILNSNIKLVLGAIMKNPSFDILSMLLIKGTPSKITMETTNMDMKILSSFDCEVESEFSICVDANRFSDIVKELDDSDDISIEIENREVEESTIPVMKITSGKCNFTLQGKTSDDYPEVLQKSDSMSSFNIEASSLASAIKKTQFSIYPNDTRFNLSGILFHTEKAGDQNFLHTVSTDGHRLSFYKILLDDKDVSVPKVIVPKKAILEIKKVLETVGSDSVNLALNDKQFSVSSDKFTLVTKLIAAEYPDYNKVIPDNAKDFIFDAKSLISSIKRVSAIYNESTETRVRIAIKDNKAEITAKKSDTDFASDIVTVDYEEGDEDIDVCYNYVYLNEILANVSSEKVKFVLKDNSTPVIIKDSNVESYFYVLMSMRT